MAARSSAIAALLVGLGGGTALFLLGLRGGSARPGRAEVDAVAADVDARLREAAAAAQSRAGTLAELPRLQAAVATDAATVRDLTTDELAFRVKPGETIEIAQVPKGGAPVSLLRLPPESKASPSLGREGASVSAAGGALVVSQVAAVIPTQGVEQMRGALAVSQVVDLTAVKQRLDALPAGGRVEVGGVPVAESKSPPGGKPRAAEVRGDLAKGVRVVAGTVGGGGSVPLEAGGGALALLGIAAAALLSRRRPAPAAPAPVVEVRTPAAAPLGGSQVALAAGTQPITAQAGAQVGRYALLKSLGEGGMASVFLARATGEAGFEKLVALKVIHPHLGQTKEVVEHFLDEARLVSSLTHPNIVQVVDLGRAGDDYYIAMEYVDGRDLQSLFAGARARGEQVPLRVAMTILRKLCDGLAFVHDARAADGAPLDLVHRDVKTANVFLSRAGAVKLGDFGIAKANQQIHKTEFGQAKGTIAYMAPEQRMAKPVDRRADVFAVGAIAYELLTGTEVNLDLANLFDRGLEGWPHLAPPSQVRPDLPPELDAILFTALAFEADGRYPTCAALEEALEQVAVRHNIVGGDKAVAQWVQAELSRA